jgi:metal transporter CNNM
MDTMLDETGVVNIYSSGYSRVPVFEGGDSKRIKGILLTRQLIVVNTNDAMPVSRMPLYIPQCVAPDENLVDLINLFQTGGRAGRVGHMALVCARPDIGNAALENDEPLPNEAGLMGYV